MMRSIRVFFPVTMPNLATLERATNLGRAINAALEAQGCAPDVLIAHNYGLISAPEQFHAHVSVEYTPETLEAVRAVMRDLEPSLEAFVAQADPDIHYGPNVRLDGQKVLN